MDYWKRWARGRTAWRSWRGGPWLRRWWKKEWDIACSSAVLNPLLWVPRQLYVWYTVNIITALFNSYWNLKFWCWLMPYVKKIDSSFFIWRHFKTRYFYSAYPVPYRPSPVRPDSLLRLWWRYYKSLTFFVTQRVACTKLLYNIRSRERIISFVIINN